MTPDIGMLPILDRIASAAYEASRGKSDRQSMERRIVTAIEAAARELVEIGYDQAIIAVHQKKRELR